MTALSAIDLYWLERRLEIATEEVRRITPDMSADELRDALKDMPGSEGLTIGYAPNGNQIVTMDGKTIEVGPMASNGEILTALQNPFVPTRNTQLMSITGVNSLKAKFEAAKQRKAAIESRVDTALTSYNSAADIAESAIKSLEDDATALQAEVAGFTNGAPA